VLIVYKKRNNKSGIWVFFFFFAFFNTEVRLGHKFFFSRKTLNVKYFLLKEIHRGTDLFHISRMNKVFNIFQNPANYFQKH